MLASNTVRKVCLSKSDQKYASGDKLYTRKIWKSFSEKVRYTQNSSNSCAAIADIADGEDGWDTIDGESVFQRRSISSENDNNESLKRFFKTLELIILQV